MQPHKPFPMPNDRLGGGIVVASVHYTDYHATILLLNPTAPFFTVTFYDMRNGAFDLIATHYNIVPAVKEYEQNGGDY